MDFALLPLEDTDLEQFKKDMKYAFRKGAENGLGESEEVLPEEDIDRSLLSKGAIGYKAILDGEIVGGAIVVINEVTQHNHLDFLYVKYGVQSKGIGQKIWNEIERIHHETNIWETCTPYFDKRNIHFYINCCGFHAVEFFNKYHTDPDFPDDCEEEKFGGMFRFEKVMR